MERPSGENAIAVDIDFSGADNDLRHILRMRPAVLRRLGWHYHRVQSFDLFADPDQVALRIARIVGYGVQGEPQRESEERGERGELTAQRGQGESTAQRERE